MKINEQIKKVLISKEQIQTRITELGAQITKDYKGKRPLVVGVLKGAFVFLADLVRQIDIDVDIDFVAVSSYGSGTTTSGKLTMKKDLSMDCAGRDVIIVEDIIDSGITLSNLQKLLLERKATSVAIATLLSKSSRRQVPVDVDYVGFEIPDEFVVGFGLDFDEKFRTLQDVCVMKN